MFNRIKVLLALALAVAASSAAEAATGAVALGSVNMRAGPSTAYPVVTVVPSGAQIAVHGCNAAYSWCDVALGLHRGWVAASYIQVVYQSGPVVLTPAVAPRVGIVVVAFDRGYWDRYYARYPWYSPWPYRPPTWPLPPPHRLPPPGTTVDRTIRCDHGACTANRVVTGPAGQQLSRQRSCSRPDQSCALTRTGPRGNSHTRIIER